MYAYDEGSEISEDEIVQTVAGYRLYLVEITGGEPLLQKEVLPLSKHLLDKGYTVLIETNGSVSIRAIDSRAIVIMDMKTPQSGMSRKMDLENLNLLRACDELKFVIVDRGDYEWAKDLIKKHRLIDKCTVLLSPAFGILSARSLSQWILEDRLPVRLNLQLHKYIYGPNERGV